MIGIDVAGERIHLHAERAAWWGARRTLLIADVHLGKGAAFRSAGIPVPEEATGHDLARLDGLIAELGAERLVVLGDLLHARAGRAACVMDAFAAWRARHGGLEVMLVRGNHDRGAGDPPSAWGVACVDGPVVDGPFVLRHEPGEDDRGYVLCGHVHPAARMIGSGGSSLRSACFLMGRGTGVLPAFGSFTGCKVVRPRADERVFAVGDSVIEVRPITVR